MFIIDNFYNNKQLELDAITFPVILILVGIYLNKFTDYTKEVLVSYNKDGFNIKNTGFTEWNQLKTWTLKTKEKQDHNPFEKKETMNLEKNYLSH